MRNNIISEIKKEMFLVRSEKEKLKKEYEKQMYDLTARETKLHKAYVNIALDGNFEEAEKYFEELYI